MMVPADLESGRGPEVMIITPKETPWEFLAYLAVLPQVAVILGVNY